MNHKHPKCKRGHRMVGKNLYHLQNGKRECRQCSLIRARRYKRELRRIANGQLRGVGK